VLSRRAQPIRTRNSPQLSFTVLAEMRGGPAAHFKLSRERALSSSKSLDQRRSEEPASDAGLLLHLMSWSELLGLTGPLFVRAPTQTALLALAFFCSCPGVYFPSLYSRPCCSWWSLEPLCCQNRAAGAFREVRSGQKREFFQLAW
jgi:hypothetical protein